MLTKCLKYVVPVLVKCLGCNVYCLLIDYRGNDTNAICISMITITKFKNIGFFLRQGTYFFENCSSCSVGTMDNSTYTTIERLRFTFHHGSGCSKGITRYFHFVYLQMHVQKCLNSMRMLDYF